MSGYGKLNLLGMLIMPMVATFSGGNHVRAKIRYYVGRLWHERDSHVVRRFVFRVVTARVPIKPAV